MRAISWNVQGLPLASARPAARMDAVARRIAGEKPHFVLLQEVWHASYLRRIATGLGPDYSCAGSPARRFGWLRGGLAVFVRRDRGWRIRETEFASFRASAPWWRLDEGDGLAGKGYLVVRLSRGGQRLTLLDTHLQAQYAGSRGSYDGTRREQAAQLRSYVASAFGSDPVLIAGDFNTAPSDPVFHAEIATLGVEMTREERVRSASGTATLRRNGQRAWIDYVFGRGLRNEPEGNGALRIPSRDTDEAYSDHDGLLVQFRLGE